MSTQDTTLPPPCGWPTMLELFIEASATLIRQAQAAECNEHNYEQLLSAVQRVTDYGQQGLSALTKQARAAIAAQAQRPMVKVRFRRAHCEDEIIIPATDDPKKHVQESLILGVSPVEHQQASYGSISDRAERGLDAGLWKAQQAQGVPAGFKLIPVEPTPEMLACLPTIRGESVEREIWANLLAAAPQAEPQPELSWLPSGNVLARCPDCVQYDPDAVCRECRVFVPRSSLAKPQSGIGSNGGANG